MRRAAIRAALAAVVLVAGAGVASAAPAPARDGNAPLTHFSGSYRLVDASGASDWDYASPDSDPAMTLGDGVWIEMRWGGRCTDPATGQLRVSHLGRHVRCG